MGITEDRIRESIETKERILNDKVMVGLIEKAGECVKQSLSCDGKILLCGNGGSASDSIHIAAELTGRFQKVRKSLPAISLNSDVAALTAIANDFGYDQAFSRILSGIVHPQDVLIGISTSGNSENVYNAIVEASSKGVKTIALLGKDGGKIKDHADISIIVPSNCTARIQEAHILIGHIICEIVEEDYD